jgi:hypothetical protein
MKKCFFFILILAINISVYGQDVDCQDSSFEKLANGITYPNCYTYENVKNFKQKETQSVCGKCKKDFELLYGKNIAPNSDRLRENFFEAALDEYKKNITNNLVNAVKVRSLLSTGAKFKHSTAACKMKSSNDFVKGCKSSSARKLLTQTDFFQKLNREVSNELAQMLTTSPDFKPRPTLLERSPKSCSIPEKDILLFSTAAYEEAISPELLLTLKKMDLTKFTTVTDIFRSDEIVENFEVNGLQRSLENHPLFAGFTKTPASFISFLQKIPTPATTENLRSVLYSKDSGESFDRELAQSCETSFKALQSSICSDEFEQGKLFNDPENNFEKLSLYKESPSEEQLAHSEKLIDTNIKFLELCTEKASPEKKNLTSVSNEIGSSLTLPQRAQSLERFKEDKYSSEIGVLNETLCSMTEKSCIEGTITCSIYKKYMFSKDNQSLEGKLANSSNSEVNELLRSMIGDTSRIDKETREILISQGIISKHDGSFVEQPNIPERRPEVYAKVQSTTPGKSSTVARVNPASISNYSSSPSTSFSHSTVNTRPENETKFEIPDFSGSSRELEEIQKEIRRRLSSLPNKHPASTSEAKKIVRDSFNSVGQRSTPFQEATLAHKMMQPIQEDSLVNRTVSQAALPNRAHISDTKSEAQKLKEAKMDEALSQMYGAQQTPSKDILNSPASQETKAKELSKVALNLADDPRVTLSEVFKDKYDRNDPETRLLKVLLRSQSNFILQVNEMNFKVVFNDNKSFNILLESGDKKEALRLRPQLELFLKKLNS